MSGDLSAYRLEIEGLGIEFVTDVGMKKTTSDGRVRLDSLLRDGLMIRDETTVIDQTLEADGMSFSLVETIDEDLRQWLAAVPDATWIDTDVTTTDTNLSVHSTSGISVGSYLHLGTETVRVTAIPGDLTVSRAQWGTVAQAHYTGEYGEDARCYIDRPASLEGRRARLYRYGLGDDPQGDGTQRWVGVVKGVGFSDGQWSIRCDSIQKLWESDISSQSERLLSLRGIYYPFESCRMELHLTTGADWDDDISGRVAVTFDGHWDTQQDFLDTLNDKIATAISAMGWSSYGELRGVATPNGGWMFSYRVLTSGPARWIRPYITGPARTMEGHAVPTAGLISAAPDTTWGIELNSDWPGARQVPRSWYGIGAARGYVSDAPAALQVDVLYVAENITGASSVSSTTELTFPGGTVETLATAAINESSGYIRTGVTRLNGEPLGASTQIKLRRRFAAGSYYDFISDLVTSSPSRANRADGPMIVSGDVDTSQTDIEAAASRMIDVLGTRQYSSIKTVSLNELEAAELALLGMIPVVGSDGRRKYIRLELPTPTDIPDLIFDDRIVAPPVEWERSPYGVLGSVTLRRGYDSIEDDWTLGDITAIDAYASSLTKTVKDRVIEPRSISNADEFLTEEEIFGLTQPWFGVLGRPLSRVRVRTHIAATDSAGTSVFDAAVCGAKVHLTSHRVPGRIAYGISHVAGVIVGREWDLSTGDGTITMLLSEDAIAGYAPELVIGFASGSGVSYDLTLLDTPPLTSGEDRFPDGAVLTDFFAVGDKIDVYQWDSASAAQNATITALAGMIMSVTFTATPTLTGTRWIRLASAADATANSDDFAYWGDPNRRINFSTSTSARVFAP